MAKARATAAANRAARGIVPKVKAVKTTTRKYRTKEEMEEYKLQDPIEASLLKLKQEYKLLDADVEVINERVKAEVEESVKFAEESPWPNDDELLKDVYIQEDYPFITD